LSASVSSRGSGDHRDLHPFPTRRSSDLGAMAAASAWISFHGYASTWAGVWNSPRCPGAARAPPCAWAEKHLICGRALTCGRGFRSEEHTSELQSRENLVCRLLLEKKKIG